MVNLYDIAYGLGVGAAAPYWLLRPKSRRKVLGAFGQRMGRDLPVRADDAPCVLVHAVSLGEMNATRALIQTLRQERPDLRFVVSTTTATGYERGQELYGRAEDVTLVRYPLDFTPAVDRFLDATRPDVVALMELEVWPNFLKQCERRGIRVVLVNGRLTSTSYRNYKLGKVVTASMFQRLSGICVQDSTYAERFIELGAPPGRVLVTGTMKFDNASTAETVPGSDELAKAVGLVPGLERIWVAGSTGPGEEEVVLRVYRELLMRFPRMRLAIVPRHPERFDEVADLIAQARLRVFRRSSDARPPHPETVAIPPVILGDTIGELRKFYALADVAFVGRSLVDQGPRQRGSDMIEPAALGKAVVVGPYTDNFAEAVRKFSQADALRVAQDEEGLRNVVTDFLQDPPAAQAMGRRAAAVVALERGATVRNARVILGQLLLRDMIKSGRTPPGTELSPAQDEAGPGVRANNGATDAASILPPTDPPPAPSRPAPPDRGRGGITFSPADIAPPADD
jgi:3-deoxy-D-manno-octulosonic-acid transferase